MFSCNRVFLQSGINTFLIKTSAVIILLFICSLSKFIASPLFSLFVLLFYICYQNIEAPVLPEDLRAAESVDIFDSLMI